MTQSDGATPTTKEARKDRNVSSSPTSLQRALTGKGRDNTRVSFAKPPVDQSKNAEQKNDDWWVSPPNGQESLNVLDVELNPEAQQEIAAKEHETDASSMSSDYDVVIIKQEKPESAPEDDVVEEGKEDKEDEDEKGDRPDSALAPMPSPSPDGDTTTNEVNEEAESREPGKDVLDNDAAGNNEKSVDECDDDDECSLSKKLRSIKDGRKNRKTLRHGTFDFQGTHGNFVFVPDYYEFDTEETFNNVLRAVGLKPPELVFCFPKGSCIVPNTNPDDRKKYWDAKEESGLPSHEVLTTDKTRDPHFNKFMEDLKYTHEDRDKYKRDLIKTRVYNIFASITDVCAQTANAIYLISDPSLENDAAVLACSAAKKHNVPTLGLFCISDFDKSLCTLIKNVAVFWDDDYVVAVGDEPKKGIKVDKNEFQIDDKGVDKKRRSMYNEGTLVDECSHRLVFETIDDCRRFLEDFKKRFSVGCFAYGSSSYELEEVVDSLKNNHPIFVLENTGLVSNAAAELLELSQEIRDGKLKDDREMKKYIDNHFPPNEKLKKCQLALTDDIWKRAKTVAQTFRSLAPGFNPDRNVIFDVENYVDSIAIQNQVTKFLSMLNNDTIPELGGRQKDHAAIKAVWQLKGILAEAQQRYLKKADLLQFLIRLALFLTTLLAVIQSHVIERQVEDTFRYVGIMMPILGSILISLDAATRPSFKQAHLLLAEKHVESQMYRFLTRTGEYSYAAAMHADGEERAKRTRELFTDACEQIFDECMRSDVSNGTLISSEYAGEKTEELVELIKRCGAEGGEKGMRFQGKGAGSEEEDEEDSDIETGHLSRPRPSSLLSNNKFLKSMKSMDHFMEDESRRIRSQRASVGEISPEEGTGRDPKPQVGHASERRILNVRDYISCRLKPELTKAYADVPGYTQRRFRLQLLTITLTGFSAGLVAFNKEEWVPVLIAAAAGFEFASNYQQLDSRIPSLNHAAGELTNVLLWWSGLTLIQTRLQSNKDMLVERVESAILLPYEKLAKTTIANAKRRYDQAKSQSEALITQQQGKKNL